jgi:hypothetical protein
MNGLQLKALRDALCEAFTLDSLDQMLRFRLNKDRAAIVDKADLNTVVFNLIAVAQREGWLDDLVRAAAEENPGSPALRKFLATYAESRDGSVPEPRGSEPGGVAAHGPGMPLPRPQSNGSDRYKPGLWERVVATTCAMAILVVVFIVVLRKEPFADQNQVVLLRTILSLAVGIIGAVVPGFLQVDLSRKGVAIRAGGALALFVITYFFSPRVLPTETGAAVMLASIEEKLKGLDEQKALLQSLVDQHEAEAKKSAEPPQPSDELIRTRNNVESDLEVVKKQLAEYRRLYGDLPHPQLQAQVGQAEQTIQAADRFFPIVTLQNSFIERYKDRVTAKSDFLVDKLSYIHPARSDGDIHIAGRSDDLGFVLVAEIMNAKDERPAIDVFRKAEGTSKPVALTGVWRVWFERGGIEPQVQGGPMTPAGSSNPDHVFEIHPVTQIDTIPVGQSLRPIEGYEPHDAHRAFLQYERLKCEIIPNPTTTTIKSITAGYNYVEFILEASAAPQEVEGGWLPG